MGTEGARSHGPRAGFRSWRWVRVQVSTDDGVYLGSLHLDPSRGGLQGLIDDGRAYLPLWHAQRDGSPVSEEFLAIHKVAVRQVIVIGTDQHRGRGER